MGNLKNKSAEKKNYRGGITIRWLITTILVIFLILASVDAAAVFVMHRYYLNTVETKLQTMGQPSAIADFFSSCLGADEQTFSDRAEQYIENSDYTDICEIWVLNSEGVPVATSTGFIPEISEAPDYSDALSQSSGMAYYNGRYSSGEHILSLTVLLPKTDGDSNGAVRFIVSLEPIDTRTVRIAGLVGAVSSFALLLVVVSGLFFVRSIVVPVNRINAVARSIANGNYKQKVNIHNRYDEISQLGESINYMTEEIDRTDKMRSDFISTISHELRTPLTSIRGWSDTLLELDDKDPETVSSGLRIIRDETQRLYSLVEDLLDFSRMESGRMSLRLEKCDLCAELEDTLITLGETARREGRNLTYEIPDSPAVADADPDRVKQVFVNVIDNAIKYTIPGGNIKVTAEISDRNFAVTVRDDGCGISAEDLPHVKEKFYKANITVKGSGIGLAVCDEIMKLHGGSLTVDSIPGKGTEVRAVFMLH